MRRSYRTLNAALISCALLLSVAATSARAAFEHHEQAPGGSEGDGPPPPPGGGEGDDEEEVLIRARPQMIDSHPSLDAFGLRSAQDVSAAFDWLTQYLERLGLRF